MKVKLSHARNPDVQGGYWEQPVVSGKARLVEVDSLSHAAAVCRAYIMRNHLGGGNWTGREVTENGAFVAKVSYNGRVWDSMDWQAQKEITLPVAA